MLDLFLCPHKNERPLNNIQSQENCVKFSDYNEIIAKWMFGKHIHMDVCVCDASIFAILQFTLFYTADAVQMRHCRRKFDKIDMVSHKRTYDVCFVCLISCCHEFRHDDDHHQRRRCSYGHQCIDLPIIYLLFGRFEKSEKISSYFFHKIFDT